MHQIKTKSSYNSRVLMRKWNDSCHSISLVHPSPFYCIKIKYILKTNNDI